MHRSSMFGIMLDLKRSRGSYIYDLNRNEFVLDLFGLYSTLPLGYNHPIFQEDSFKEETLSAAPVKVPNCEMATPEGEKFLSAFSSHPSMAPFKYFHFSCTGALAIEAAVKAAVDYRKAKRPIIITFKESFHGINGYGGILTDRFGTVRDRLDGFPGHYWGEPFDNPVIRYHEGQPVTDGPLTDRVLEQIRDLFRREPERVGGVLVEAIQCTVGDQYFDPRFLKELRKLCTEFKVPLIFDEIQTGFGGTGTMWYFEQCGIVPDIVAFGKKTQTSGIMVREPFGRIFERPVRLEVTWDGDVLDMIRCRYILKAYRRYNILENVRKKGAVLAKGLTEMRRVRNLRQIGLLIAFDLDSQEERDRYVRGMREQKVIVLSTQRKAVRWRPNLALTGEDAEAALTRSSRVVGELLS